MSRKSPRFSLPALAIAAMLVVGGCGLKGPLYIPDTAVETDDAEDSESSENSS